MTEPSIPLRSIEAKLTELNEGLHELEAQQQEMLVERRILRRWRDEAIADQESTDSAAPLIEIIASAVRKRRRVKRTATTARILRLVTAQPGIMSIEVANRLAERIKTKSKNPRRIIQNSISNLLNRELRRDDEGQLFLLNGAAELSNMKGGES